MLRLLRRLSTGKLWKERRAAEAYDETASVGSSPTGGQLTSRRDFLRASVAGGLGMVFVPQLVGRIYRPPPIIVVPPAAIQLPRDAWGPLTPEMAREVQRVMKEVYAEYFEGVFPKLTPLLSQQYVRYAKPGIAFTVEV